MRTLFKAFGLLLLALVVIGSFRKTDNVVTGSISRSAPSAWESLQRDALAALKIRTLKLSKGGFGSVLMIDRLAIANTGDHEARDIVFACDVYGQSGAVLGNPSRTLFIKIPRGQTHTVSDLNMGFIHDQTSSVNCALTGMADVDLMK